MAISLQIKPIQISIQDSLIMSDKLIDIRCLIYSHYSNQSVKNQVFLKI